MQKIVRTRNRFALTDFFAKQTKFRVVRTGPYKVALNKSRVEIKDCCCCCCPLMGKFCKLKALSKIKLDEYSHGWAFYVYHLVAKKENH